MYLPHLFYPEKGWSIKHVIVNYSELRQTMFDIVGNNWLIHLVGTRNLKTNLYCLELDTAFWRGRAGLLLITRGKLHDMLYFYWTEIYLASHLDGQPWFRPLFPAVQKYMYLMWLVSCWFSLIYFQISVLVLLRSLLKGQCHEDFAVLGQFWAKIITLRLYS